MDQRNDVQKGRWYVHLQGSPFFVVNKKTINDDRIPLHKCKPMKSSLLCKIIDLTTQLKEKNKKKFEFSE